MGQLKSFEVQTSHITVQSYYLIVFIISLCVGALTVFIEADIHIFFQFHEHIHNCYFEICVCYFYETSEIALLGQFVQRLLTSRESILPWLFMLVCFE